MLFNGSEKCNQAHVRGQNIWIWGPRCLGLIGINSSDTLYFSFWFSAYLSLCFLDSFLFWLRWSVCRIRGLLFVVLCASFAFVLFPCLLCVPVCAPFGYVLFLCRFIFPLPAPCPFLFPFLFLCPFIFIFMFDPGSGCTFMVCVRFKAVPSGELFRQIFRALCLHISSVLVFCLFLCVPPLRLCCSRLFHVFPCVPPSSVCCSFVVLFCSSWLRVLLSSLSVPVMVRFHFRVRSCTWVYIHGSYSFRNSPVRSFVPSALPCSVAFVSPSVFVVLPDGFLVTSVIAGSSCVVPLSFLLSQFCSSSWLPFGLVCLRSRFRCDSGFDLAVMPTSV